MPAVVTYVSVRSRFGLFVLISWSVLICAPSLAVNQEQPEELNQQFQAAVAQYNSRKFAEAAAQLEKIERQVPESFEVQELLGMVYSAESRDDTANSHLERAVRLKPDSSAARTNLGASYARVGKLELAEKEFKKAVELEPGSFDTNHFSAEMSELQRTKRAGPHPGEVGNADTF